jgi:hypothetical protein
MIGMIAVSLDGYLIRLPGLRFRWLRLFAGALMGSIGCVRCRGVAAYWIRHPKYSSPY